MRGIEILREMKEHCYRYDKNNAYTNALSSAIKLYEELEKVEGVLPKKRTEPINDEITDNTFEDGWNACLHQVKLILTKQGLCRKPTAKEIAILLNDMTSIPFDRCIELSQAIMAKLEGR